MARVLIVEDDPSIARGLRQNLRVEGYEVLLANDGKRGLEIALADRPDLVLLDVMMPGLNGFEVLRELRRLKTAVPVILLTARGEQEDKVRGLDLGADDYATKPFGLPELLARVRSVLRRHRKLEDEEPTFCFGDVEIDFVARSVTRAGETVKLTTREFDLLHLFVEREGAALSRDEMVNRVWGYYYEGTDRTLDNFVSRLRRKLEKDASAPQHFLTVRGLGYRFVGRGS